VYAQPLQVEAERPRTDEVRSDHPEAWRPFPVYAEGVWAENPTLTQWLVRRLPPRSSRRVVSRARTRS
jgi:hypothetical protein